MMAVIRRLNYQHLLYFWSVVRTGSLTRACEELALSRSDDQCAAAYARSAARRKAPGEIGADAGADRSGAAGLQLCRSDLRARTGTCGGARTPSDRAATATRRRNRRRRSEGDRLSDIETRTHPETARAPVCREGTLERLVADLAVHEIDVVISDAPITPSLNVRAYSHSLGTCEVPWMATPTLAKTLRRGFPKSLDGVPVLLPTDDTAIRRALDQWFDKHDVHPVMIGEFEDYAMLREFARAGHGFAPVPSLLEEQFRREYGFARVGLATRRQRGVLCDLRRAQDQEPRRRGDDRARARGVPECLRIKDRQECDARWDVVR